MRCTRDGETVPKTAADAGKDFRTVRVWGWVHHTEADGWHTVTGTLLVPSGNDDFQAKPAHRPNPPTK